MSGARVATIRGEAPARTADGGTLEGRRVLVTGATGFIGSHVVRRLVAEGATVHILARGDVAATRLAAHRDGLVWWRADVTDPGAVLECVRRARPEVVIHLAADTSGRRFDGGWEAVERSIAVNLQGTLNVLRGVMEARAPVSSLVRLGGLEEYGNAPTPYDETLREQPVSPYSASQVAATHYCELLQRRTRTAIVTLRPALVYGPAQSTDFLIPALVHACLRDDDAFELGCGRAHRDLLYVDDLVDAVVLAAGRPDLRGAIVNLGHGVEHAVRDVAAEIVRRTGARTRLRERLHPARAADLEHLVTDTARARALLGWAPRVGLDEGLERTVAWYREQQVLQPC